MSPFFNPDQVQNPTSDLSQATDPSAGSPARELQFQVPPFDLRTALLQPRQSDPLQLSLRPSPALPEPPQLSFRLTGQLEGKLQTDVSRSADIVCANLDQQYAEFAAKYRADDAASSADPHRPPVEEETIREQFALILATTIRGNVANPGVDTDTYYKIIADEVAGRLCQDETRAQLSLDLQAGLRAIPLAAATPAPDETRVAAAPGFNIGGISFEKSVADYILAASQGIDLTQTPERALEIALKAYFAAAAELEAKKDIEEGKKAECRSAIQQQIADEMKDKGLPPDKLDEAIKLVQSLQGGGDASKLAVISKYFPDAKLGDPQILELLNLSPVDLAAKCLMNQLLSPGPEGTETAESTVTEETLRSSILNDIWGRFRGEGPGDPRAKYPGAAYDNLPDDVKNKLDAIREFYKPAPGKTFSQADLDKLNGYVDELKTYLQEH